MGALIAAYAVEVVVIFGCTIGLAVWLRRQTRVGYALAGAGALVFVASQVVHLPLNWAIGHVLPNERGLLWVTALVLGLSAGLCEEVSRYVAIRWVTKRVRDTEHALMLGMGHGGVEALIVGALASLALFNLLVLENQGDAVLAGLTPEEQLAATASIEQIRALPAATPLLGALERLMVLPFHLAATLIVTWSVARSRPVGLALAIGFHAALDAPMAWLGWTVGPVAAELWIGGAGVASLAVLWLLGRRMRRVHVEAAPVTPRGATLELLDTSKTYGGTVRALRGASLVIEPGTRTCLLGPNGAGKTTAIRIATGGIAPSRGHAFLFGASADDPGFVAAKRRLGVVPQQPGMYDDLTVRDWLELVRDLYGRGDVDAMAKELEIEALLPRPMGKLSGGQKRRVAIAAALVGTPELLILDEPSAGLDPVGQREVLDFLDRLAPSHTILLCTHDLDEAEELCERVVVMRDGEVLVHEAIDTLRERMEPQLALRVSSDEGAAAEALEALGHAVTRDDGALLIHVAEPDADAPRVLRALLDGGVDVVECRVVRPSLEELFLEIVAREQAARASLPPETPTEEPVPPPIPLGDLVGAATKRLLVKEWRQLRASGAAFWTSLLVPVFMLLLLPQSLVVLARTAASAEPEGGEPIPDVGFIADIAGDPSRLAITLLPLFVTLASIIAPTALVTHSIVNERETRTLELLVALPVRIQQVVAAKLGCAFLFAGGLCGAFTVVLGVELLVLGLATVPEVLAMVLVSLAATGQATTASLLVALHAKDFRTANNLAGVIVAPTIFLVMGVTLATSGTLVRPLVITLLFVASAFALGRVALRSATFEKLLS